MTNRTPDTGTLAQSQATSGRPHPPGKPFWFAGRWRSYDYGKVAARLGKAPDAALAREIGSSPDIIGTMRRKLGIPPYSALEKLAPYLGRIPDRRLALHFGMCAKTVARHRRRLGRPPARPQTANADTLLREYVRRLQQEIES